MRALAWLVSVVPAVAAASPCPSFSLEARVATPKAARLAPGGGFVVLTVSVFNRGDGKPSSGDIAAQSQWRVTAGGRTIAPGIRVIAPGLAVYDVGDLVGEVTLENDAHDPLVTAFVADKPTDLDPPVVKAVDFEASSGAKHPWTAVTATLAKPPPAHAIAVIVYGKDGARSWSGVQPGGKIVGVYTTGGCAALPNGTLATSVGDEVELAWVADSGRVSKKSAKVKVRKK